MRTIFSFRTGAAALLYLSASLLSAQQYVISTYAGGMPPFTPLAATSVAVGLAGGIAVDGADNVFFSGQNCIFSVDRNGVLTRAAGNYRAGYSGDGGLAVNAQLNSPDLVAIDNAGNLYVTDSYRVRRVSAAGIITTVAGNGTPGISGDGGPALAAQINSPDGLAVDQSGNIYLADNVYGVRKISAAGIITTIAGTATPGYSGDGGPAAAAQLNGAQGLAVDGAGNLYIADSSNYRVRKVTPQGVITTFAGNGTLGYSGDGGRASDAQIDVPDALAFDRNGNLYIAASYNFRVRRVSPDGIISTVYPGDSVGGTEGEAIGFGVDSAGNLYFSDDRNYRVRRISPDGIDSTAAGNGFFSYSGDGGPAIHAQLFGPQAVALDKAGNLYVADTYNHRIRRITPGGLITTVAGDGTYGSGGDGGPAVNAQFRNPWALAVDSAGNVYIADASDSRIRRVTPDGIIATFAGGDTSGNSGDGGPAINAQLNAPTALAVDNAGNLYIADAINQRIRKVSTAGIITSVPINAGFADPTGIAIDNAGNLYIADETGYGRVTKVSPQGIVTTAAGAGDIGGPLITRRTPFPVAVAVDSAGNVYFTDPENYRVRRISTDGSITTIAGNGTFGYSGDGGPGTSAQLYNPMGLALDGAGRVFIADTFENAIRLLQPVASSINVTAVTNGGSNLAGPVSPGEIVVLYGSRLGPATLNLSQLNSAGKIDTQLAGASVLFNGIPAPILYTFYSQVAAIVPYEVSGTNAQVLVSWQGQTAASLSVPLATSAPGLFTLDSTGQGQAAADNQDGSVNSAAEPAAVGSLLSLYATGEGLISPAGIDGKIAAEPLPHPLLPVMVTLGGRTLTPEYAGSVAGEAEGLIRIDVRIPADIASGSAVPVVVIVGGVPSQAGVTVAVGTR